MDVYFSRAYAECYCEIEKAEVCEYTFSCEYGEIYYIFLKRKIESLAYPGYYDIITPYGYGGPIITQCEPETQESLLKKFSLDFTAYCMKSNIVSEFVRFHPLLKNYELFKAHYNPEFNRHTVCVDLTDKDSMNLVTSQCRNMIRKAIRRGVQVVFDFSFEYFNDFLRIYNLTMNKNSASDYYYFSELYFSSLRNKLSNCIFFIHAFYHDEIVASSMFIYSNEYIHYHLSGTNPVHYELAANNLILLSAIQWGIDNNKKQFHLGGGSTSALDDPLLRFKKAFSKSEYTDFYVGKKIYNQDIYNHLCMEKQIANNSSFFPKYRDI